MIPILKVEIKLPQNDDERSRKVIARVLGLLEKLHEDYGCGFAISKHRKHPDKKG